MLGSGTLGGTRLSCDEVVGGVSVCGGLVVVRGEPELVVVRGGTWADEVRAILIRCRRRGELPDGNA